MENRILILFFMLLSLFLLFSAVSAILTVLHRHRGRRLPSVVWGVLFILPLIPFSLPRDLAPVRLELTVDAPGNRVVSLLPAETEKTEIPPYLLAGEDGSISPAEEEPVPVSEVSLPDGIPIPARLWDALLWLTAFALFLWLTLSLAHVTHRVCSYAESIHFLTSRSAVCHNERICAVFRSCAARVHLHRNPQLRVAEEGIHLSPCTAGFLTPTVYISALQAKMGEDELEYIFLHELCHVKRHDFFLKVLALLSTSVHFFAPFSAEVRRQVYEDCELGCDRMVLSFIGTGRCSRYMQTILAIAEQGLQGGQIRGELFSYASGTKELLLKRYRNLLAEEKPLSIGSSLRMVSAVLAALLLHTAFFATIDARPAENPLIRLQNPYLEAVVREYYNLPDNELLTMTHLDGIYSLEFSLSRKTEKHSSLFPDGTLAMCCVVNEGKYYLEAGLSGEEWAVMLQQDGLADGISPDLQYLSESRIHLPATEKEPVWADVRYDCAVDLLPDVCPLAVLERYLPEDAEDRAFFLSHYTCLDGTEEALERYASAIYMEVIRENSLTVASPEEDITAAFIRYCAEKGITFDPDKSDILSQLRDHRREEVFALSPAALSSPMAFLNPDLTETERETLLALLSAEGKLNEKCLTGMTPDATGRYALDLADLVLFENLRTVILNDRLIMADKTALTESWCAVIEH